MNTAATERTKHRHRPSINGGKKFSESANSVRTDLSYTKAAIENLGMYEGQVFRDSKVPNGKGRLEMENGVVYSGDFKDGKMTGFGVMEDFEGNYYEGEFKNGQKHGKGLEILEGGEMTGKVCYEGKFNYDAKDGYGKPRLFNRYCKGKLSQEKIGTYNGYFSKGEFNGYGIFKWKDRKTYKGIWSMGTISGNGKMVYPNGDVYEGDFLNGKRHGEGTLQMVKSSTSYTGPWFGGKQHGIGMVMRKGGQSKKAFYSEGKFMRWIDEFDGNFKTYQEIDDLSSIL